MEHQYTENDYCRPEEVLRIIQAVPEVSVHPDRDRLLISIGWETGGRASEVLTLVPERVLETSIVLYNLKQRNKNGKVPTKIVEVSSDLCEGIRKYCGEFHIKSGRWLFPAPTDKSRHLDRISLHKMITKASEAAHVYRLGKADRRTGGIGRYKGISYHVLRHSYATFLLRECNNLRMVQQQLGHSNITSTQKYANVAMDDVRATIASIKTNLYHP